MPPPKGRCGATSLEVVGRYGEAGLNSGEGFSTVINRLLYLGSGNGLVANCSE
jgi:hypothetical protein